MKRTGAEVRHRASALASPAAAVAPAEAPRYTYPAHGSSGNTEPVLSLASAASGPCTRSASGEAPNAIAARPSATQRNTSGRCASAARMGSAMRSESPMQCRMSMRKIQRGSRKSGNHIQFTSVATSSTSPSRRSVLRIRGHRAPVEAPRTCTRASENPAEKMNAGATSPSIHCSRIHSGPVRSSGRRSDSACIWIMTTTAMPRSQSNAWMREFWGTAEERSPRGGTERKTGEATRLDPDPDRPSMLPSRRLHAGRFPLLLRVVRRPRCVALPRRALLLGQFEQAVQRAGLSVDRRRGVASFREALRDRGEGEVRWIDLRHLAPVERRGHAGVGSGPYRVGRSDGAVLRVLVVVEEDAVALLLPPLAGRDGRGAAFHLARERQRGGAHLRERPAALDAHVDVHAARAGGLGEPAQPVLLEHLARDQGHLTHLRPGDVR